jgi:hypothetical protein
VRAEGSDYIILVSSYRLFFTVKAGLNHRIGWGLGIGVGKSGFVGGSPGRRSEAAQTAAFLFEWDSNHRFWGVGDLDFGTNLHLTGCFGILFFGPTELYSELRAEFRNQL